MRRRVVLPCAVCLFMIGIWGTSGSAAEQPFTFGMLLVGPHNDRGWSQAHYEAGLYVESKLPGAKMVYLDKVNSIDRPGLSIPHMVDDLVGKGARLVIASSAEMRDGAREAAIRHPETVFIHVSGDDVLTQKAPPNLGNIMGRMEYPRMMAGFVAGMTTQTGKIGYLGPLVNEETRRFAVSSYLGAVYAWEKIRRRPRSELQFRVSWIGFWFSIPGVTADAAQVSNHLFDSGYDVVISGIDTTEALAAASQKRRAGRKAWAIAYDYKGACQGEEEICLGVSYFNWGPAYLRTVKAVREGRWKQAWESNGPDWKDINNEDTSAVGFLAGPTLFPGVRSELNRFIEGMASGKINLFKGPLYYSDGKPFLAAGETATDRKLWYMEQLLKGMESRGHAK